MPVLNTPNPGALVRSVRTACGLTQTELARLADVEQSQISRIETGYMNPTIDEFDRLLRSMGHEVVLRHRRVKHRANA